MQDSSRPVNPFLKPAPPQGANVVESGTHPEEKGPLLPAGSAPLLNRHRVPTDMTGFFIVLAGVVICSTLLTRTKLEHCVNDGSRWNTVFYLVEYGTYEFLPDWGQFNGVVKRGVESPEQHAERYNKNSSPAEKAKITGLMRKFGDRYYRHVWDIPPFPTVDMICIKDGDKQRFYSSKPPLLSTCAAGVVIGLEKVVPPIAQGLTRVAEVLKAPGAAVTGRDAAAPASQPAEAAFEEGFSFRQRPMLYMRLTVILLQVIPFLLMIWVIRKHVIEQTDSPFVQNFCIGAAALATYLTSYAAPLNNHLVAAYCALFAIHAVVRVWRDGRREWYWFVLAGLFAGLCHGLELPATLLTIAVFGALLYKARNRAVLFCLPAILIPIAASLYTTYLVTDSVMPIPARFDEPDGPFDYDGSYWHKNDYFDGPKGIDAAHDPKQTYLFNLLVGHHGYLSLTPLFVLSLIGIGRHFGAGRRRRTVLTTLVLAAVVVAVGLMWRADAGGSSLSWPRPPVSPTQSAPADVLAVASSSIGDSSDGGSRWAELQADLSLGWDCVVTAVTHPVAAIDQGADLLWGWGFLSLMAMLLVVNLGMYLSEPEQRQPLLAISTLVLFLILLVFYTFSSNNYAGVAQGPRWLFWLIPFWLLMLPAGLEPFVARRLGRWLCYLFLFVSLVTVAWGFPRPQENVRATDRPYTTSWLHEFFISQGWSNY